MRLPELLKALNSSDAACRTIIELSADVVLDPCCSDHGAIGHGSTRWPHIAQLDTTALQFDDLFTAFLWATKPIFLSLIGHDLKPGNGQGTVI